MSKFGGWKISFSENMPQKVATAVAKLDELVGATYKSVAYLGSQQVNGTNHAVLAEQTVITGKDTKNAVVLIFNEKPNSMDVALVDIHRIVEGGGEFGGTDINLQIGLPEEAQKAFESVSTGWVGVSINPLVYIGSKITKGTEYKFLAETTKVVQNPEPELLIVTVNQMEKKFSFENVLS